ncbi:hypothetical protein VP01_699g4 [Puccinia sorghi]|uniref:Uncharacterized protein n=1 Tax=Puccinia sorghi TaxID=27349 RepID=A0A0L6UE02_9BASI|nr:hypothetical protein VP01_699g4 [Puccinia sorghi]
MVLRNNLVVFVTVTFSRRITIGIQIKSTDSKRMSRMPEAKIETIILIQKQCTSHINTRTCNPFKNCKKNLKEKILKTSNSPIQMSFLKRRSMISILQPSFSMSPKSLFKLSKEARSSEETCGPFVGKSHKQRVRRLCFTSIAKNSVIISQELLKHSTCLCFKIQTGKKISPKTVLEDSSLSLDVHHDPTFFDPLSVFHYHQFGVDLWKLDGVFWIVFSAGKFQHFTHNVQPDHENLTSFGFYLQTTKSFTDAFKCI